MAFHVHRGGAGFTAQHRLGRLGRHHLLDADQALPDDPLAREPRALDQFVAERASGKPVLTPGHHLGGDHHVAGLEFRVEAARHAEADDTTNGGRVETRQEGAKL